MTREIPLRLGEKVMPKAPKVQLSNGDYCIPQHYLTYHHTLESVEALICDIEYDPRYIVFAAQEQSGVYIQVGVIGHDNYYKKSPTKNNDLKLLFGRKWRVEPELPTSEVIQSVFLAIKKSREHEIRELFKLSLNGSITTPFNTHIDLPLMTEFYDKKQCVALEESAASPSQKVSEILQYLSYDNSTMQLQTVQQRGNGLWLVDISVLQSERSTLPEMENRTVYLQVPSLTLNTISRALMQEYIRLSDLHVDQHFSYQGFHRFDPNIDIADIADLSQQTRKHELAAQFASEFSKTNEAVDLKRIPVVQSGVLAKKHKQIIEQFKLQTL